MKRSTRRRATRGVLYALLLGAVVLFAATADWGSLSENFMRRDIAAGLFPEVLTIGLKNTILYTAISFGGGLALALVLALMRLSPARPYRWLAMVYIEVFRGLPALLVIVFFGLGVPLAFPGWQPPGGFVGSGVIALIVVSAAYMAETLRAGIQAVPKGQLEAARSLGMSSTWAMISIVLPQAFRIVIPPLTNEFVLLIKDTALLSAIGMQELQRELTTFARDEMSNNINPTPLVVSALVYLIVTIPLTQLVALLERKQQRAR